MPGDDEAENQLRELLRDPRWSLPPWPDAEARVRRATQRQRMKATGLAMGVAAVIAAIVVPLTLMAGNPAAPVGGIRHGQPSSASSSRHANRYGVFALPAVGAAGFPVSIYPPPPSSKELNLVGQCPSASGVQPPGPGIGPSALAVVQGLGHSFQSDLRLSDRVYWPQTLTDWREGFGKTSGTVHVLYSGPLESYHQAFGPPDMSHTILTGCGHRIAADTWMIVTGQLKDPGLQGEYLLLDRDGHVLLWNAQ